MLHVFLLAIHLHTVKTFTLRRWILYQQQCYSILYSAMHPVHYCYQNHVAFTLCLPALCCTHASIKLSIGWALFIRKQEIVHFRTWRRDDLWHEYLNIKVSLGTYFHVSHHCLCCVQKKPLNLVAVPLPGPGAAEKKHLRAAIRDAMHWSIIRTVAT